MTQFCQQNSCMYFTADPACTKSTDCNLFIGKTCVLGRCVPTNGTFRYAPVCKEDTDCSSERVRERGSCVLSSGSPCIYQTECRLGEYCVEYRCSSLRCTRRWRQQRPPNGASAPSPGILFAHMKVSRVETNARRNAWVTCLETTGQACARLSLASSV